MNMLNVSGFRLLPLHKLQQKNKVQHQSYATTTDFTPQYKYNLNTDVVSFKGAKKLDRNEVKNLVSEHKKREGFFKNFSDKDIENITNTVTEKNYPYLKEILELGNNKLLAPNVLSLLNYINDDKTDIKEFDEKFDNFKNLKSIVKGFGFKQSILADNLDKISPTGVVDILKSDLLLRNTKHNYNSLVNAYNYVASRYDHYRTKQDDPSYTDEFKKSWELSNFMKNNFSNYLLLNMIFEPNACNELIRNRGQYIGSVYMPRFRVLNEEDLVTLRHIQTSAVTDKENKGGNLSLYPISIDDKIGALNLLALNREIINAGHEGLDIRKYFTLVNDKDKDGNFKIKFQNLKIDLKEKVLKNIGIDPEIVDNYMTNFRETYKETPDMINSRDKFWDPNYVHLLNAPEGSLLRNIIKNATSGKFKRWIYKDGDCAEVNKMNEAAFEKAGIDYERWLEPTVGPMSQKFTNKIGNREKTFTVSNWRRIPQESLFDGNYTTCCTGIDKDHGKSFLEYMTNTCTTTLEVRTEKNKVVAMSRIIMAKVNGKLSMVVENIEVNNKIARNYLYNDENKYKFREMIFDYARKFAKDINKTGKDIPVYFCSNYYKVSGIEKGLEKGKRYDDVELIGQYPDVLYINSYGGRWDTHVMHDDGDGLQLSLSNITEKADLINEDLGDNDSDTGYNYEDVRYFNQKK